MRSAFAALALTLILLTACVSKSGSYDFPEPGPRTFSPNAQRLMNYLADQYGEKIISGQMDTSWTTNSQMDMIARVYDDTGKYPAIKGFDMAELPFGWSQFGRQQINEAIDWWDGKNNNKKLLPEDPDIHGIVTFCWHWRRPSMDGNGWEFYSKQTFFFIPWADGKLDTRSAEFKSLVEDMDKAAALLQLLKDRDIPVLWRPLHEASGKWFWWGVGGAEPYIALWEFMYNYFTVTKGLDNLIWVWNGQHKDWFPNPATVDIVGFDVYTNSATPQTARNYISQQERFNQTLNMVPDKNRMVAMTENGAIPDPDQCFNDNAMWSWFCTWNDGQRNTQISRSPDPSHRDNFWAGEYHNTNDHKKYVYNHERVITLDKLPDLSAYRLE